MATAKANARARRRPRGRAPRAVLVLSAYPSAAAARRAARALVAARILACATVTAGGRAVYRWEGKMRDDPTALLWGKTVAGKGVAAVRAIRAGHPDRLPEILLLPVSGGHAPFLAWVASETRAGR